MADGFRKVSICYNAKFHGDQSNHYRDIQLFDIQDGNRPLAWKSKKGVISAMAWPILTKFDTMMHLDPIGYWDILGYLPHNCSSI